MSNHRQDITISSASQAEQLLKARRDGKVKLYEEKDGKLVIHHAETMNTMIAWISRVPMDNVFKKILIMRLGAPFLHRKAMSYKAIAISMGISEDEVEFIELEAKKICNEFMEKSTGNMQCIGIDKLLINDTLNEVVAAKHNGEDSQ